MKSTAISCGPGMRLQPCLVFRVRAPVSIDAFKRQVLKFSIKFRCRIIPTNTTSRIWSLSTLVLQPGIWRSHTAFCISKEITNGKNLLLPLMLVKDAKFKRSKPGSPQIFQDPTPNSRTLYWNQILRPS